MRKKPHVLLAHEALLRRLKPYYRNHPAIQSNYQRHKAGFYGESRVDYKLSLMQKNNYIHIPGVRLNNHQHYFQIDSIIITPKLIFIIEAKNMQGVLEYYASQRQLVQITDQVQQSYKDPILQAKLQVKQLKKWIGQTNKIPIEFLVVSTNPATIIKNMNNEKEFNYRFVTLENLTFRMDEIYHKYQKHILNKEQMNLLAEKLIEEDSPLIVDLIDEYGVEKDHLINGIPCSNCEKVPVKRINKMWICSQCGKNDRRVHERVIFDYFLLHGKTITNSQCQKLLKVSNRYIAYRILKTMKLSTSGQNKAKKYMTPAIKDFPQNGEYDTKLKILQKQ